MDTRLEQRVNIKFFVGLVKSATETLKHNSWNGEEGGPVDQNWSAHLDQRRFRGVGYFAWFCSVNSDFSDLGMHRVAARFVPKLLNSDQKPLRVEICHDVLLKWDDDPSFLSRIITGDETWVYGYDPQTKQQSSQEGNDHLHHDPRKPDNQRVDSKACWPCSLTFTALCIENSYLEDKASMPNSPVMFWSDSEMSNAKDHPCGKTGIRCFSMAMQRLIMPSKVVNWVVGDLLWLLIFYIRPIWPLVTFSSRKWMNEE